MVGAGLRHRADVGSTQALRYPAGSGPRYRGHVRCIVLSDLHVHRKPEAGENRTLERLVAHLRQRFAAETRPHVVITGDLTDNGAEDEYHRVVALLRPLVEDGFVLTACPGNHDVGLKGNSFMTSARIDFQRHVLGELLGMARARSSSDRMAELYPLVTQGSDAVLVGLDTANDEGMLASGRIGRRQLELLREIVSERDRGKGLLVFLHHHPFDRRRSMRVEDAEAMLDLLDGQADVLCFGHRHVWGKWPGYRNIGVVLASGKSTKQERRRGPWYWEVTVGRGAPQWARRLLPRR